MNMLGVSISKNSLLLGLFALVTAAILAGTQAVTADRIAASERKAAQRALLEIVPLERHDNDLLLDTIAVAPEHWELLGLRSGGRVNIARDNGQPVAAIVPAVAHDGYSGDIKLIIGINRDGTIAGVRALAHNETPGLGDKVELKKSDWILSFNGKSLAEPGTDQWAVKKDGGVFDQFTGATITPRAVVNQVKRSLEYFQATRPLAPATDNSPPESPVENTTEGAAENKTESAINENFRDTHLPTPAADKYKAAEMSAINPAAAPSNSNQQAESS